MDNQYQTTLVLLKPDSIQRALIGRIIERIENTGLKICGLKMLQVSRELAAQHYEEHQLKPFYKGLIEFITSLPIVAMVICGPNAIKLVRKIMGATDPYDAVPGTIRSDFAVDKGNNLIHGSANEQDAEREIQLFFSPDEIFNYKRQIDAIIW